MAGYMGFSMSNNAFDAYMNGEKPMSRWKKQDILDELEGNVPENVLEVAKKMKADDLRNACLVRTSWHHTSEYYNRTDFYSVRDFDEITVGLLHRYVSEAGKKTIGAPVYRKIAYLIWGGTKRYPTKTRYVEVCQIVGRWAMTSHGKKLVGGSGFEFLD